MITPIRISEENIKELKENEIFVFGSNIEGHHGGGAAKIAVEWGAIWGQAEGLQGKTYGIPTMFTSADKIKPFVDNFLIFAKNNRDLKFLVTKIGCGIAGFSPKEIAPLFRLAVADNISNIYLPKCFYHYL